MNWRKKMGGKSLGFVPTMGALHHGHLSLVKFSQRKSQLTLVSIFVNPTQFGPKEDLKSYPRTLKEDLRLLKTAKVNAVFIPSALEMYPRGEDETKIEARASLSNILEGRFRPGHFDGVVRVVLKLLNLARPTHLFLGEKDYQQCRVIEALIEDLFLDTKLIVCPTRREKTGLALSSRNRYLSPLERGAASELYKVLRSARNPKEARTLLEQKGFSVQYLESWDEKLKRPSRSGRWLTAVRFKGVRLIDNFYR